MKYYLLIPGMLFYISSFGQQSTKKPVVADSLELSLYGSKFYVNYLEIDTIDVNLFKNLQAPVYLINNDNFTFGKKCIAYTNNVLTNLLEMDTLSKINDSIYERKEKELNYIITQSNERINNFKDGYLQCQDVNKELSRMLDDSIKLNKDQSKSAKWGKAQYLIWGILGGGLLGTFIGFQAVH
ncbi:MAG: hypothetical protein ABI723_10575 [Bacteroidia bacterium]